MITGGQSAIYRQTLVNPHRSKIRVEVWNDREKLSDLIVNDGAVSATLTSRVSRQATLRVSREMFPSKSSDLLAPFGNIIKIFRGIEVEGPPAMFPVFTGRINTIRRRPRELCDIACVDFGADLIDSPFERTYQSNPALTVGAQIRRIIGDGFPYAQFGRIDDYRALTPPLIWEDDRAKALDDLAGAVGAFWYALQDGTFTLRTIPWTTTQTTVASLNDATGTTSGDSLIVTSDLQWSRQDAINVVVINSQRNDGSPPIRVSREITDPASPVFPKSKFGRHARVIRTSNLKSVGQAQALADSYLARGSALTKVWDIGMVPDASLELGDCVVIDAQGYRSFHILASITMPLKPDGLMAVRTRQIPDEMVDES